MLVVPVCVGPIVHATTHQLAPSAALHVYAGLTSLALFAEFDYAIRPLLIVVVTGRAVRRSAMLGAVFGGGCLG